MHRSTEWVGRWKGKSEGDTYLFHREGSTSNFALFTSAKRKRWNGGDVKLRQGISGRKGARMIEKAKEKCSDLSVF